MTPKKINLSYTAEDGSKHSREYTDLSQVWQPASEPPQEIDAQMICNVASLLCPEGMTYAETTLRGIMHISSSWQDWERRYSLKAWAYLEDLLPSGSCSGFPNNPSKKSNSWKLPRPTIK